MCSEGDNLNALKLKNVISEGHLKSRCQFRTMTPIQQSSPSRQGNCFYLYLISATDVMDTAEDLSKV